MKPCEGGTEELGELEKTAITGVMLKATLGFVTTCLIFTAIVDRWIYSSQGRIKYFCLIFAFPLSFLKMLIDSWIERLIPAVLVFESNWMDRDFYARG